MGDDALHLRYAAIMRWHSYGYALYEPASASIVKPGVCGYFDSNGSWNPIADLTDPGDIQSKGLTPISALQYAPTQQVGWGPKTSKEVRMWKVDLKAGVSGESAGIPAAVKALYRWKNSCETGAILITKSPVTKEMLYYESPYENWCKENFRTIVAKFPDSLRHGIFVVTTTYSTEKASLNANIALGREGDIGFEAEATPIGEIAPSVGFCYSSDAGAWIRTKGEGTEKWVVFASGLYFKKAFFSNTARRAPASQLLDPRSGDPDPKQHFVMENLGDEPGSVEIELDTWGELTPRPESQSEEDASEDDDW